MKPIPLLLLTCLTCFSQSVELRSVTILGGVEIGTVGVAEVPATGSPGFNTKGTNALVSASSSLTLTNLVVDGANKLLICSIGWFQSGVTISSVTWNNGTESLTLLTNVPWYTTNSGNLAVYYKVAPSTITTNVIVTFSGSCGESAISACVFTNVNQSTPLGDAIAYSSGSTSVNSNQLTISGISGDLAYSTFCEGVNPTTITNRVDEVRRASADATGTVGTHVNTVPFDDTTEATIWTISTSTRIAHIAVAIKQP